MSGEKPVTGRAIGGKARAAALSPERRSEIASIAARAARRAPADGTPRATHSGVLEIGDALIPCYVLENGERILSTRGIMKSLGRRWRGRKYAGTQLPVFVEANNLKPFLPSELDPVLSPQIFRTERGAVGEGFKAEILPVVCEAYLQAREKGDVLTPAQHQVAQKCEMLTRGLARVGIIALVDEATGYQDERAKSALRDVFDAFLRKELAAWVQRFPEEFYREIFRLRGWDWKGMKVNRPQVVAYYTVDIVYSRLLPHIMEELESRMPRTISGRRKGKLHQLFSDDVGHPALAQHLYAVITLMRVSDNWKTFMQMLDIAHPRKTDKWLKELYDAGEPPLPANDASEPLPLFERLQNAALH